jgi:hypothetical protein
MISKEVMINISIQGHSLEISQAPALWIVSVQQKGEEERGKENPGTTTKGMYERD